MRYENIRIWDMGIWEYGNIRIWDMGIWEYGDIDGQNWSNFENLSQNQDHTGRGSRVNKIQTLPMCVS